ncbi:cornulin-like [Cyrtonyx montezumae]|uniref:cornulin-like n=1 Tax=Cyrtonyx montezumae TaxID=9017 RepID=UPI0032D9EDB2
MAQLQDNINGIIATFYTYARSDGDSSTLSKGELRQLIEQELEDMIMDAQDPRTVEKVLLFLDEDSSGKVDFGEFLNLVFRVAKACHKQFQQYLEPEVYQEPTAQEEADGEQHHKQVPEQGVSEQVQEGGTPQRDQDTQQHWEGEEPKNHQDTQQKQEGGTPKDQDTQKTEKSEIPKVQDTQQTQKIETPKNNQGTQQNQKSKTPKDGQGTHQDDRAKAREEGTKRGEILVTEMPEQDKNTQKAEKTPKHDPKPHQDQVKETPKLGHNHNQREELEPAQQIQTFPTKIPGRTTDKTKEHAAPRQDPSPRETHELPPPVRGTSPHPDPQPLGRHHDPAHLPDPTVWVQEGSVAEAHHVPGQRQHGAHGKGKHVAEQEHLQPQWPPQK